MNQRPSNCGKDGFTYDEARRLIKKMVFAARRKGKTVRSQAIYRCPGCRAFHVTSHSYHVPKREAA